MARDGKDRIFNARVSPERDAELYACIERRVDGEGMTFKEFLLRALRTAYPEEFAGMGLPPAAAAVPARPPVPESLPAEVPVPEPAGVPVPVAATPPAVVAPAVPSAGYGLDDRFDGNLRRTWLP